MEYRILDSDGNIVAWIDSNNDEQLVRNGYTLEIGKHLKGMQIDGKFIPIVDIPYKQLLNKN